MKAGRSLEDLAREITRQQEAKEDLVADTVVMAVNSYDGTLHGKTMLALEDSRAGSNREFELQDLAHDQIADVYGIPRQYYHRLQQQVPSLLDANVNGWFRAQPKRRMVRTLDGRARAFLSDRYRRLDNGDMAEAVLPVLLKTSGLSVESSEITDRRLYIKAVTRRRTVDIALHDPVMAGIVISNSEVGLGAVAVEPLLFRLACYNGMIVKDLAMKQYHLGRRVESDDLMALFRDETMKADDRALWLKIQDVVAGVLQDDKVFDLLVERAQTAAGRHVEDPIHAVEVLAKRESLADHEKSSILGYLAAGGEPTAWTLANAVTRYAQDVDSYDRATELEALGGKIITLPASEWRQIATEEVAA